MVNISLTNLVSSFLQSSTPSLAGTIEHVARYSRMDSSSHSSKSTTPIMELPLRLRPIPVPYSPVYADVHRDIGGGLRTSSGEKEDPYRSSTSRSKYSDYIPTGVVDAPTADDRTSLPPVEGGRKSDPIHSPPAATTPPRLPTDSTETPTIDQGTSVPIRMVVRSHISIALYSFTDVSDCSVN